MIVEKGNKMDATDGYLFFSKSCSICKNKDEKHIDKCKKCDLEFSNFEYYCNVNKEESNAK